MNRLGLILIPSGIRGKPLPEAFVRSISQSLRLDHVEGIPLGPKSSLAPLRRKLKKLGRGQVFWIAAGPLAARWSEREIPLLTESLKSDCPMLDFHYMALPEPS